MQVIVSVEPDSVTVKDVVSSCSNQHVLPSDDEFESENSNSIRGLALGVEDTPEHSSVVLNLV